MVGARSPRVAVLALTLGLGSSALVAGGGASPVGAAPTPHRAAVIVETGATTKRVVITFAEESITGIDALQRAGMNPVVYQFGGQGGAVCRILGVGRDAGPGCLGGQDGDARYWAYFRAVAGTSAFKYSSAGAGSVRVHDGDVEGWKFGTGAMPAFVPLASLIPQPPPSAAPPTTPATTAPAAGTPDSGGTSPGPTAGPAGPEAGGSAPAASTLPVTGARRAEADSLDREDASKPDGGSGSRSERSDRREAQQGRNVEAALASSDADDGGRGAASLLWFLPIIAAIVGAVFVVRHGRKQAA